MGNRDRTSQSKLVVEVNTRAEFETKILESKGYVVLHLYIPMCPSCRKVGKTFDALAEELKGVITFAGVNIQKVHLEDEYRSNRVPRFCFFKDGKEIAGPIKVKSEDDLYDKITQYTGVEIEHKERS